MFAMEQGADMTDEASDDVSDGTSDDTETNEGGL
jgi:hypothetical protein